MSRTLTALCLIAIAVTLPACADTDLEEVDDTYIDTDTHDDTATDTDTDTDTDTNEVDTTTVQFTGQVAIQTTLDGGNDCVTVVNLTARNFRGGVCDGCDFTWSVTPSIYYGNATTEACAPFARLLWVDGTSGFGPMLMAHADSFDTEQGAVDDTLMTGWEDGARWWAVAYAGEGPGSFRDNDGDLSWSYTDTYDRDDGKTVKVLLSGSGTIRR